MLEALIRQQIQANGPLTFAQLMEMALYHPGYGYYTSDALRIGQAGDFYTAPTTSSLFGAMLARQFQQLWQIAGCPTPWVLVEYGPGTGHLAKDVVTALAADVPKLHAALKYYLVETSDHLKKEQQALLNGMLGSEEKFNWVSNLGEIKQNGQQIHCVYANELVDAFPVHLVVQTRSGLQELYVNFAGESLEWQKSSLSSTALSDYFKMQQVELELGQKAEVNLRARDWLVHVAANLTDGGFLLIIDYGLETEEMYLPQRFQGTLRCFRQHRLESNPLLNLGEQDITSNVNFSALVIWGEQMGLKKLGLVTQPKFLINLGLLEMLQEHQDYAAHDTAQEKINAIKKLVLPGGMGNLFKILMFSKNWPHETPLNGLK